MTSGDPSLAVCSSLPLPMPSLSFSPVCRWLSSFFSVRWGLSDSDDCPHSVLEAAPIHPSNAPHPFVSKHSLYADHFSWRDWNMLLGWQPLSQRAPRTSRPPPTPPETLLEGANNFVVWKETALPQGVGQRQPRSRSAAEGVWDSGWQLGKLGTFPSDGRV